MGNTVVSEGFLPVPGGQVWYQTRGDGGGDPLLLLHGGPGFSHLSFEPLAELASTRPVIWYDQLGSGRSDRPTDPTLWRTERFVEELAAVREALGLSRVHLLGHSWGTMLLASYLATAPEGVASAIFSSPCLDAARWTVDQEAYVERLPEELRDALRRHEQGLDVEPGLHQRAVDEFYRRHLCRLDPWPEIVQRDLAEVNLDVYESMWGPNEFTATGSLRDFDATGWLAGLALPTLFTSGRYDEATPESTAFFARQVAGSRTHVFERSGHLSYVEEPEEYRRVIADFLDEVERA